jgi:hypothetical protein
MLKEMIRYEVKTQMQTMSNKQLFLIPTGAGNRQVKAGRGQKTRGGPMVPNDRRTKGQGKAEVGGQ